MSYLSFSFVVFAAIVFLLFYSLPQKVRPLLLLLSSLVFYLFSDPRYLFFLVFVAGSTFFAAKAITVSKYKKTILILCIGANALLWFAIKELSWALHSLCRVVSLLGLNITAPKLSILVPLGISYYTLQAIAYLVDVYSGKIEPEVRFWKYLLFLAWFPAIVQGPISRYNQLMPQLLSAERCSFDAFRKSLLLILFGLVKKMVLADRLGIFVSYCFANQADLHGVILYFGAILYSIQLYADFSGCVDICRGISGLFGVDLVQNFRAPYLSTSIKEFWNRWHMSLSGWLKDYVYIPLGGNRKGSVRKYFNIGVTFMVSGIWHGAGFNFLAWGLLHAGYQIFGDITKNARAKVKQVLSIREGSVSERIYKTVITFHLVSFAWIIFRAGSMAHSVSYITNMFSSAELWVLFDGSLYSYGLTQNHFILMVVHIVVLFFTEIRHDTTDQSVEAVMNLHLILRWGVYLLLIFDVLLFGVYGSGYSLTSFMYGGF